MSITPHIVLNDASIAEIATARGLVVIRYQDGSVKVWDNESASPALTSVVPGNIVKIAAGTIKYYQDWLRVYALLDANGIVHIKQFDDEQNMTDLIPTTLQRHAIDVTVLSNAVYITHENGKVYAMNHFQVIIDNYLPTHTIQISGGKHDEYHDDNSFYTVYLRQNGTVLVNGPSKYQPHKNLGTVTAIAASESHIMALLHDGSVVAWGDNSHGACDVPADLGPVVAVAAGDHFSVVLLADGRVRGWGDNSKGQYNFPNDLPNVRQICTSFYETYVLTESGSIIRSH